MLNLKIKKNWLASLQLYTRECPVSYFYSEKGNPVSMWKDKPNTASKILCRGFLGTSSKVLM